METIQFTVKELIEELQAADPEMPVYVWDSSNDCYKELYYACVEEIEDDEYDSFTGFTLG